MDTRLHKQQQVSLRGASAKEISRDALLEKVAQEREFRNYMRRATAASLFIQRVWRRYVSMKTAAVCLREEWQEMANCHPVPVSGVWISNSLLRPFLFFVTTLATRGRRFADRDVDCMQICFRILLESINSSDKEGKQYVVLTSMAMRFVVSLTDLKSWKAHNDITLQDADTAVKDLVWYMCSEKIQLYISIRKYLSRLDVPFSSNMKTVGHTDDKFLITASAITLALRPFNNDNKNLQFAAEQYCVLLLTIPWFTQRLPVVLLSAIKHKSILSPCFREILSSSTKMLPPVGWALANIFCLAIVADNNSQDSGRFTPDLRDGISKKKKKWVNMLNKITGKSQGDGEQIESVSNLSTQIGDDPSDVWDIEPLRKGPEGLTADNTHLIHLFCATYSHLLLVVDDIEFYEKQVPFTLEQQRRIAAMLNTLVYNALSNNVSRQNRPLMDAAVRCLHLLYERDCRHQFCPPDLWLSPAKRNRPPIAVAARTHEVMSANLRPDDSLAISSMHSVITTTPHVFPFEERYCKLM
ncbi:hypothetical protein M8C21_022418 [Ambrosia artemisiifolia]|uniref:HECT-type E3 ubiquitin transferase n=1 Tax=Ambrosia artemisiifolia TaxID=4212 RepID=A0AAD5D3R6_AMBAR|nr:hypothetical protein M8C21_022418 [Ambrosia artemisiifolia]